MPETVPPAEPSASADPRSVDGPAPTGPLRLDGAFARRDREDWERAAIASLGEGGTLESLARTTLDELRIEVLHDESPVRGRLTPDVEASGEDRTTDNRLVVLGWNASDANAHALVGLAGGVTSLEFTVRKRPDATGASDSTSASRSSALGAPNPLAPGVSKPSSSSRNRSHLAALLDRGTHRLLAEHRLAERDGSEGDVAMRGLRGGDDDGLNRRVLDQHPPVPGGPCETELSRRLGSARIGGRGQHLAHRPKAGIEGCPDRLHGHRMALAHVARADDADPDRPRHAFLLDSRRRC